MNNCWLKKCEKSVTDVRKGKTKGVFLVNDRECFALSHFIFTNQKLGFYICFFNCQSCKCG